MEQLSDLVLIVPVISKADTMTMEERHLYLHQVHQTLSEMSKRLKKQIIYDFNESFANEESTSPVIFDHYPPLIESSQETMKKQFCCPNIFAVVADTRKVRVYPWGTLSIEDENHSDFRRLQRLLFEQG